MLKEIMHIGITVSDMERSISFYRDILGLDYKGELIMEGTETDALFRYVGCKVRVAYLNGSSELFAPPVELIQFLQPRYEIRRPDLRTTSISEICFHCEDIDRLYQHLRDHQVACLSDPQFFDFTKYGFGKSRAIYFKDPDGIILEAIQNIDE
jgi:glyoxylase I family protein